MHTSVLDLERRMFLYHLDLIPQNISFLGLSWDGKISANEFMSKRSIFIKKKFGTQTSEFIPIHFFMIFTIISKRIHLKHTYYLIISLLLFNTRFILIYISNWYYVYYNLITVMLLITFIFINAYQSNATKAKH